MIKKYWAYLLLLFSVLFFVYQKIVKENQSLRVKAFNVHNGWGYDIYKDNKLIIHQDMIPEVDGHKTFASKDEAIRLGELVVSKIKQGKGGGLPRVTIQEIDSLKITR
jgi:hypothetical protein